MEQKVLSLVQKREKRPVSAEVVCMQQTLAHAIGLAITMSGLDDKEVYGPLGIDASHWTKIKKGDAHFPVNKLNDLMDMCGNEAPLIWLANSRGYGLVVLKSEAEKRADDLQKKLDEAELENRVLMKALGARK